MKNTGMSLALAALLVSPLRVAPSRATSLTVGEYVDDATVTRASWRSPPNPVVSAMSIEGQTLRGQVQLFGVCEELGGTQSCP